MNNKKSAYAEAGVDTEAGEYAVGLIKKHVQKTFGNWDGEILSGVGGFGAILEHTN